MPLNLNILRQDFSKNPEVSDWLTWLTSPTLHFPVSTPSKAGVTIMCHCAWPAFHMDTVGLFSGLCVCTASTLSTWAISPDPHILISKLFMHPKRKNLKNSLLVLFKMPSFHCEDETIWSVSEAAAFHKEMRRPEGRCPSLGDGCESRKQAR